MILRKVLMAVAVMALGVAVASPAQAGGTGGAVGVKKTANLQVKNGTATGYYLVAVPSSLKAPTTVGEAKKLGGVLVNAGKTIVYPVPNGKGQLAIIDSKLIDPSKDDAPLPPAAAKEDYSVAKGKMKSYKIVAGPDIVPVK